MIRASNCCTARGGRSGGVVNETKGNILHKAQAHPPPHPPFSSLDIHFPVSVAMRRQNQSCQPRPCVIHTYTQALYVVLKMALWVKDEEVCVHGRVCVCAKETTPFSTVTMEFIIILMMPALRRVSVG